MQLATSKARRDPKPRSIRGRGKPSGDFHRTEHLLSSVTTCNHSWKASGRFGGAFAVLAAIWPLRRVVPLGAEFAQVCFSDVAGSGRSTPFVITNLSATAAVPTIPEE